MAPRTTRSTGILAIGLIMTGCASAGRPHSDYHPQVRDITITTVPVLVREHEALFPFLKADFARGGILEGREVYAFVPGTITAIAGDTLHLAVINPEDDAHTLVLPGLSLALPGQRTTRTSYVAPPPGIYPFVCDMPAHQPMMWGQLVVLSPHAVYGDTLSSR
jgi:hypothetical protein